MNMSMNLKESTTKRRLFGGDNDHEGKRSKQEEYWKHAQNMYGDGVAWFRGAMIGKGSFGRVFVANLKNQSRYSLYPSIMAVKSSYVSASGSVQKEKEVMDNINGCPYVIKCFGEEITNGDNGQMVYNLLLEYGSGGTLADVIKSYNNGKGLPELDVRRHARSILRGLSHIHKSGYVHCDVKPQNVMLVANEGKVGGFIAKIGDLGLAKRMKQIKKNKPNNYGPCWRGTPMYLSPEAVDNGVQEQPADVWAVGCIVFEMLTGKPLWFSSKDMGVNEMISRIGDENDLFSRISSVSAAGRSFLKKCLCRKVMCRLSAKMLLKHPFLKGLPDDDDDDMDEVEESSEVFDINTTSSSLFSDDEELWLSSCSEDEDEDEDADVAANGESMNARFHEVQLFPIRL